MKSNMRWVKIYRQGAGQWSREIHGQGRMEWVSCVGEGPAVLPTPRCRPDSQTAGLKTEVLSSQVEGESCGLRKTGGGPVQRARVGAL